MAVYARFGQELYTRETVMAAAIVALHEEAADGRSLTTRIAERMPHPSPATRLRVATKLLQRVVAGATAPALPYPAAKNGGLPAPAVPFLEKVPLEDDPCPVRETPRPIVASFARLLSGLEDSQARCDLVYYATARADALVGAIAREVLYPYFIENRIPSLYTEDEFIIANASLLLAPEPILTAGLVADYARRAWGFDSERTVGLALRILRQAGILLPSPLLGERGRVQAYTLAPHGLSLAALLWGLYDEFGGESVAPALDQVTRSCFARLFVVPSSVVLSRLWEAEKAGLVGTWSMGGSRRIVLKVREPEALTRLLLSGPCRK